MDAKKFLKELQSVVYKFEVRARNYGEIVEATEVEICKGYLVLCCTGEDKHGDSFTCSQEVEIYNDELNPLYFFCD